MKNKNVGFMVMGIAIVIAIIVLIFNAGLKSIVGETCSHGGGCTMYQTIATQTYLSLAVVGIILVIGLFLIFSKENEKIIIKRIKFKEKKKKINLSGLDSVEKKSIKILEREGGAFFQKSLMDELGVGKVKMTRMMDKLEAKQIVERKRRGMNNIVVLKN